jgi:hypothetical protein
MPAAFCFPNPKALRSSLSLWAPGHPSLATSRGPLPRSAPCPPPRGRWPWTTHPVPCVAWSPWWWSLGWRLRGRPPTLHAPTPSWPSSRQLPTVGARGWWSTYARAARGGTGARLGPSCAGVPPHQHCRCAGRWWWWCWCGNVCGSGVGAHAPLACGEREVLQNQEGRRGMRRRHDAGPLPPPPPPHGVPTAHMAGSSACSSMHGCQVTHRRWHAARRPVQAFFFSSPWCFFVLFLQLLIAWRLGPPPPPLHPHCALLCRLGTC